jgi:hypothetical protein
MREYVIGAAVVSLAGLGVFFYPSSEPEKVYPLAIKQAVVELDRTEPTLRRLTFADHKLYSVIGGWNLVQFIDRKNGHDVICEARLSEAGDPGVTVAGSCLDGETGTPMAEAQKELADLTLLEVIDSTLTSRPFDQTRVNEGLKRIDISQLSAKQVAALKQQARIGDAPEPEESNADRARDLYAQQYNQTGGGEWGSDAVHDSIGSDDGSSDNID